jgi:hypothetical protein
MGEYFPGLTVSKRAQVSLQNLVEINQVEVVRVPIESLAGVAQARRTDRIVAQRNDRETEKKRAFRRPAMSPAGRPEDGGTGFPFPKFAQTPTSAETDRRGCFASADYLTLAILITSNFSSLSTTSMPFVTRPITAYLPFRLGFATLRMKNWLSAESGGRPVT